MGFLKITIWPIIVTILLVISILRVFSQDNSIVYIPTSQFGGLAYEQVEVDENCPAYLKLRDDEAVLEYESSVSCETYLSEQSLDELPFYKKDSLTDSLKEEIIISENIDAVDYLYASNDLIVTIPKEEGEYHLGIDSNVVIVTTFTYGTCQNCSIGSAVGLSNPSAARDSGEVARWSFTNNNGNDNYGLFNCTNTGVEFNSTTKASVFEGPSDKLDCAGTSGFGTQIYSYMGWIYLNNTNAASNPGNFINFNSTNYPNGIAIGATTALLSNEIITIRFLQTNANQGRVGLCDATLNLNGWYHIAAVDNTTNWQLYLNGERADNCYSSPQYYAPLYINDFTIGNMVGLVNINGTIDEVRIFNRSLSASEIATIYQQGLYSQTGNYSSPIHNLNSTQNLNIVSWVSVNNESSRNISFYVNKIDNETNSSLETFYCESSPCSINYFGQYYSINAILITDNKSKNVELRQYSLTYEPCFNNISYYETSRVEDDCTLDDNQTTTIYYISTDLNDCGNYSDVYSSETSVSSCNYAGIQMQELREEFNMIAFVLLYAIFLCLGIYLLTKAQTVLGLGLIGVTIGMDFFLIQDLYTRYVQPNLDTSWMGTFTWIFGASFIFWIITKISMPILLAQKGKGV